MADATSDLELIRQALRRDRNSRLALGVALALSATAALIFLPGLQGPLFRWPQALLVLAACTGVAMAFYTLMNFDVNRETLIRVLEAEAERVVWVYPYRVIGLPWGIQVTRMTILYIMLEDGDRLSLRTSAGVVARLMNLLKARLPWASFGYSTEKAQLYRADPQLLRRC